VLDLGCGIGHLARLYREVWLGHTLYLLDRDLISLLLSAWVLGGLLPQTCRIAMKIDGPLPMAPGSVGLITSSDSFYAFKNQRAILESCRRVLVEGGRMLLTHLHNRDRPDEPFQCFSHCGKEWRTLLESSLQSPITLISDEVLRTSLAGDGALGIADISPDNPRSYSALMPAVEALAPLDVDSMARSHLSINPIYEITEEGEKWRLIRRSLSELFESEHEPGRYFSDLRLPKSHLAVAAKRAALLRSGVLVPSVRKVES
jgi:SAM-dependent methyltransferase